MEEISEMRKKHVVTRAELIKIIFFFNVSDSISVIQFLHLAQPFSLIADDSQNKFCFFMAAVAIL